MQRAVRATGAVALFLGIVTASADAAGRVWFVPWKVLDPGAEPAPATLVLYWVPASQDELRRSGLVTSRALTVYSARCVAMHVVRLDDAARLDQLGVTEPPAVVLFDDAREAGRILPKGGALRAAEVEEMVRDELVAREAACQKQLDTAHELARNRDFQAAAVLYEQIAQHRCAFPRLAREAERALAKIRRR